MSEEQVFEAAMAQLREMKVDGVISEETLLQVRFQQGQHREAPVEADAIEMEDGGGTFLPWSQRSGSADHVPLHLVPTHGRGTTLRWCS